MLFFQIFNGRVFIFQCAEPVLLRMFESFDLGAIGNVEDEDIMFHVCVLFILHEIFDFSVEFGFFFFAECVFLVEKVLEVSLLGFVKRDFKDFLFSCVESRLKSSYCFTVAFFLN